MRFARSLITIVFFFFILVEFSFIKTTHAANNFQTGWWIDSDSDTDTTVPTYASQGNTLVLLAGWVTSPSAASGIAARLKQAEASGIKMIVGIEGGATPTMSVADITTVVNTLKGYSALYAWYIGDEPELTSDQSLIQSRHTKLATDPGYYPLIKKLDTVHPVMISFNHPYNQDQWVNQAVFYDVTDIIGIHSYPFGPYGENGTIWNSNVYDVWKQGLANSKALGKQFIATCQGFGDNSGSSDYKSPTPAELRYQVFSAVVQGVDKVMFWIDSWGQKANMMDMVKNQVAQIQEIGAEMNNGTTNDSRIGVSLNDPSRTLLTYRYGSNGTRTVLLAVNIANRTSSSGQTLSNVQFTLPAGVNPTSVTVLDEKTSDGSANRTLPVTNGKFTDSFKIFEVHAYAFDTNSPTTPTPTPTPTPNKAGDATGDGLVNEDDYNRWLTNYNKTGDKSMGNFNDDTVIDGADYVIWLNNFGK